MKVKMNLFIIFRFLNSEFQSLKKERKIREFFRNSRIIKKKKKKQRVKNVIFVSFIEISSFFTAYSGKIVL